MKTEKLSQDPIVTNSARSIKELRRLPIDELADEEIVRVIRDKFKSQFALIAYESDSNYLFLSAYRGKGNLMIRQLQIAWEEKFGHIEVL
jgi:hypothetical protein